MYYVRPSSDKVYLIDKFGRGVPETVMSGGLNHPYGLKVVQKQRFLTAVERKCISIEIINSISTCAIKMNPIIICLYQHANNNKLLLLFSYYRAYMWTLQSFVFDATGRSTVRMSQWRRLLKSGIHTLQRKYVIKFNFKACYQMKDPNKRILITQSKYGSHLRSLPYRALSLVILGEEPPLTPPDVCECRHGGVCHMSASGHLLCQCQGTGK